jgi:DNA repair photolyase
MGHGIRIKNPELPEKKKGTSGTKEWASTNLNICSGCSNNCLYCYAKRMAHQYKRMSDDQWENMIIDDKKVKKGYMKREGVIMFPSSHDITEHILPEFKEVLIKLLKSGNHVLVVSKPKLSVIHELVLGLSDYKDQLEFRFTITSKNDETLKFWEPNAPTYNSRFQSLRFVHERGFKTSVSIEPFLDNLPDLKQMIIEIEPFCSEIWIGKMNNMPNEAKKLNNKEFDRVSTNYYTTNLIKLAKSIYSEKVVFKDSIKNILHVNKPCEFNESITKCKDLLKFMNAEIGGD